MSETSPLRVLSISDDDGIRYSRELVLMNRGYEVESIESSALLDDRRARSFNIAILCHSIDPRAAEVMARNLRRLNPSIGILRVRTMLAYADSTYDVDCEVLPDPRPLLTAIETLSTARKATASRIHIIGH